MQIITRFKETLGGWKLDSKWVKLTGTNFTFEAHFKQKSAIYDHFLLAANKQLL